MLSHLKTKFKMQSTKKTEYKIQKTKYKYSIQKKQNTNTVKCGVARRGARGNVAKS